MWAAGERALDGVAVLTVTGDPMSTVREELDELTLALRTWDRVWTVQILDRLAVEYPEVTAVLYQGLGCTPVQHGEQVRHGR